MKLIRLYAGLLVFTVAAFCSHAVSADDDFQVASGSAAENRTLQWLLGYAKQGLEDIRKNVRDYTCDFCKREQVQGQLVDWQYMQAKVRHQQRKDSKVIVPFSVYLKFVSPPALKGREVLYVSDRWNGDLIVRRGGTRLPNTTLRLEPEGPLAMDGQRYPVTEFGMLNIVRRLIDVLESKLDPKHTEVQLFKDAKLNGRPCLHIQVIQTVRNPRLPVRAARIFVDNQLQLPVYFASYDWPAQPDGKPVLLEEYIYYNIKANVGLTDRDFARNNPAYSFSTLDKIERRAE